MAEFLVYNQEHWMDKLTQQEIDEHETKQDGFQAKYDRRYQKGDIVEIRPDGKGMVGLEPESFALVSIPGMSVAEAEQYAKPYTTIENPGQINEKVVLLKRRKYKMDLSQIALDGNKKANLAKIDDAYMISKEV